MLSDITILILAVLTPILSVFCFIKGYNIGARETKKPEIKIETPKEVVRRKKTEKEADEKRRRAEILLSNIDVFDGTSKGQKEFR